MGSPVLVLMWLWQCLGHKVIAKHMCDHDVTRTCTRSHGYGFLPGQNICTRTRTLGKTRRLPAGLPIPVQYTNCETNKHQKAGIQDCGGQEGLASNMANATI